MVSVANAKKGQNKLQVTWAIRSIEINGNWIFPETDTCKALRTGRESKQQGWEMECNKFVSIL